MEFFDFNLQWKETKRCSIVLRNTSYFNLSLFDFNITEADSIYWFRIENFKLFGCDPANFIVSKKKGPICVFESFTSDTAKIFCVNRIGQIPESLLRSINNVEDLN